MLEGLWMSTAMLLARSSEDFVALCLPRRTDPVFRSRAVVPPSIILLTRVGLLRIDFGSFGQLFLVVP